MIAHKPLNPNPMSVHVNASTPALTLYSTAKEQVNLADFQGENAVLLLFFPQAFTGVCTNELNMVNNDLSYYTDHGVQVFGISTDSVFTLIEYAKVNQLNFPLLSDHDAVVATVWGTKYPDGGFALGMSRVSKRSAFLVDRAGIIRYAEVLEKAGDLPNFEAIHAAIEAL